MACAARLSWARPGSWPDDSIAMVVRDAEGLPLLVEDLLATGDLGGFPPRFAGTVRAGADLAVLARGWPSCARKPAQRAGRPSSFSILRRSRLVGRPAPRARTATGTASSRGGGGGLLSM